MLYEISITTGTTRKEFDLSRQTPEDVFHYLETSGNDSTIVLIGPIGSPKSQVPGNNLKEIIRNLQSHLDTLALEFA